MQPTVAPLSIEQQRATIQSWENMPDPLGKRPKGATPQEVAYYQQLFASQQRIAMMPRMPVTVVNINPYPAMVLHPLFSGLVVAANKPDQKYSALVIRDVKYQVNQGVDRNHSPVEFWPIQLAAEFETQYREKGGVFHFNGDLEKHPELAYTDAFKAAYAKAEKQLLVYCWQMKRTADGEWNTPNRSGFRNIHAPHRTAAKLLFDRKLISELPKWMEGDAVDPSDVQPDCPICRSATKKGQLVCACSYTLDPAGAFKAGVIEETNSALERLTRAQVTELGVSTFVAETSDERPARLAAGQRKPLSQFEAAQQKALDKETPATPATKGGK